MTTRNRLLVPLSAVLVAALVIALTYALSARDPRSPAVLRLAGVANASTMSSEVAPAAAGSSADSRSSAPSGYQLSGPLPQGRPDDAPVYALDGPWSTDRLAKALDRAGLTTDHASWWWSQNPPCAAAGPAPGAAASKPGAEAAPDAPVSSDKSATPVAPPAAGCASGSGSSGTVSSGTAVTTPVGQAKADPPATEPATGKPQMPPMPSPEPTTPAMTTAQARAAAQPVFEALDLPIADAQVTVSPWGATVWIDPVVKGLPTSGYTTRVEVGRDKQISYASGFLGDLGKGDSYPLVTAKEAFDRLSPPMTDMMCRVGPNGQGCAPAPQQEVTGAVIGLALQQTTKGDQLLVPAWLFDVKGWTERLPHVAVDGKYLGQPEPRETAPVSKDGGSQTEPGTVVDPVPPASPPKG